MGMAMFRTCGSFRSDRGEVVTIHAGVIVELISGRDGNVPQAVVRSTLTGEVFRPNTLLVLPITGMDEDSINDLALDIECDCP